MPSLSLPKSGGAIRGIGETFTIAGVTGTGRRELPLPAGRGGLFAGLRLSAPKPATAGIRLCHPQCDPARRAVSELTGARLHEALDGRNVQLVDLNGDGRPAPAVFIAADAAVLRRAQDHEAGLLLCYHLR